MISYLKNSFYGAWPLRVDSNSDSGSVNTSAKSSKFGSNQDVLSKAKSGANFRCRSVAKFENQNALILSVNVGEKFRNTLKDTEFASIDFHINGRAFFGINGNVKDEDLSETIKNIHEFSICIIDCEGNKCVHTPDQRFQKNLIKCINEGMISFYRMRANPDVIHPLFGKTQREYFGDEFNKPTCSEFARYLKYDDSGHDQLTPLNGRLINSIKDAPEFSHVIMKDAESSTHIHEFIHIAHGICLHKVGTAPIYFAEFHQVHECYGYLSDNYQLVVAQEKLSVSQLFKNWWQYLISFSG